MLLTHDSVSVPPIIRELHSTHSDTHTLNTLIHIFQISHCQTSGSSWRSLPVLIDSWAAVWGHLASFIHRTCQLCETSCPPLSPHPKGHYTKYQCPVSSMQSYYENTHYTQHRHFILLQGHTICCSIKLVYQ